VVSQRSKQNWTAMRLRGFRGMPGIHWNKPTLEAGLRPFGPTPLRTIIKQQQSRRNNSKKIRITLPTLKKD
jgi:hypothetical protein